MVKPLKPRSSARPRHRDPRVTHPHASLDERWTIVTLNGNPRVRRDDTPRGPWARRLWRRVCFSPERKKMLVEMRSGTSKP